MLSKHECESVHESSILILKWQLVTRADNSCVDMVPDNDNYLASIGRCDTHQV